MNVEDVSIVKITGGIATETSDEVAVEEPLEIHIDNEPYYLTMRLPGEEIALAAGFCYSEGIIDGPEDLASVGYCRDVSTNRVNVFLDPVRSVRVEERLRRKRSVAFSSCGICGKTMIDEIVVSTRKVEIRVSIPLSRLQELQRRLKEEQTIFNLTGATHAAGVFTASGDLLASSEDVGRHNALDKAIGTVILAGRQADAALILLTSRLSYEMVQKAARLGVEIVAGVSPPTSLAINLARSLDITLVGFLRQNRGNIYTRPERIRV